MILCLHMETSTNTKTRLHLEACFSRKFLHREQRENQKRATKSSVAKKNLPLGRSLKMLVKNTNGH
jgi:hypothetical protein